MQVLLPLVHRGQVKPLPGQCYEQESSHMLFLIQLQFLMWLNFPLTSQGELKSIALKATSTYHITALNYIQEH